MLLFLSNCTSNLMVQFTLMNCQKLVVQLHVISCVLYDVVILIFFVFSL